jgi:hypothetical protein
MKKTAIVLGVVLCLLAPVALFAQPGFGDDVTDTPIDGGISLLVVAGVGYGVKKLKAAKDRKDHL